MLPVLAQTSLGVSTTATIGVSGVANVTISAAVAARIKNLQTRADEEITRRITALNTLSARVNAMEKISSIDKTSLSSTITAQISALTTLQAQIATDAAANSTTSLVSDVKSITGSYRIFALIIPQGAIEAAADRVLDVAATMTTLSGTFSTRLSAAQTVGANVTAAEATLTDFNAKVADADVQANAATSEVATLTPDNGVTAQMQANTAALKDARTKIQAGQQDLIAARADAQVMVKDLIAFEKAGESNASGTVSTSATVSASTTTQ